MKKTITFALVTLLGAATVLAVDAPQPDYSQPALGGTPRENPNSRTSEGFPRD